MTVNDITVLLVCLVRHNTFTYLLKNIYETGVNCGA